MDKPKTALQKSDSTSFQPATPPPSFSREDSKKRTVNIPPSSDSRVPTASQTMNAMLNSPTRLISLPEGVSFEYIEQLINTYHLGSQGKIYSDKMDALFKQANEQRKISVASMVDIHVVHHILKHKNSNFFQSLSEMTITGAVVEILKYLNANREIFKDIAKLLLVDNNAPQTLEIPLIAVKALAIEIAVGSQLTICDQDVIREISVNECGASPRPEVQNKPSLALKIGRLKGLEKFIVHAKDGLMIDLSTNNINEVSVTSKRGCVQITHNQAEAGEFFVNAPFIMIEDQNTHGVMTIMMNEDRVSCNLALPGNLAFLDLEQEEVSQSDEISQISVEDGISEIGSNLMNQFCSNNSGNLVISSLNDIFGLQYLIEAEFLSWEAITSIKIDSLSSDEVHTALTELLQGGKASHIAVLSSNVPSLPIVPAENSNREARILRFLSQAMNSGDFSKITIAEGNSLKPRWGLFLSQGALLALTFMLLLITAIKSYS